MLTPLHAGLSEQIPVGPCNVALACWGNCRAMRTIVDR